MVKLGYLLVVILGFVLFNSCSNHQEMEKSASYAYSSAFTEDYTKKAYGAYLAGRIAHQRRNFDAAADYYIKALEKDPNNQTLRSQIYIILTSKGRIAEAATHAQTSRENGDKNNIIPIIISVDEMKQEKYGQAIQTIDGLNGPIYKEFINPLLKAWAYAGENQPDKALKELQTINKETGFRALYNFHAGMINDYFDRTDDARKHYEVIVNEENLEMSFRALQVITNFYIRNGEQDKAVALVNKYNDEKMMIDMLDKLSNNVRRAIPSKTPKIINSPQLGLSEALFSIAATLRQGPSGVDLAHIFICLSIYSNPKYDLAKLLLADILENREMYAEANDVYNQINQDSVAYYSAQIKKANNLVSLQDYKNAEILLKSLSLESPQNYQVLLDLGDVLRLQNKHREAIRIYEQAAEKTPENNSQRWVLYYAMGISHESNGQWKKAEENLLKALEINPNNYLVLNYLGYSWLKQGINTERAFGMIVDAYNQVPNDGHITDSLGWAFYSLGMYDQAVFYLEKAAEIEPANALINSHLGDAYWLGGRKNEARFQWQHALSLPDDSGEVNSKEVEQKIINGTTHHPVTFDKTIIEKKIKDINKD